MNSNERHLTVCRANGVSFGRTLASSIFILALGLVSASSSVAQPPPTEEALKLRNLGLAQLENDKPSEAQATYEKLVKVAARDPLPHANLAIAQARQQQYDTAIATAKTALRLGPGRGDVLAIVATTQAWGGQNDEALATYQQALTAAPTNPRIVYSAFRHAGVLRESNPTAEALFDAALEQMVGLRPDNLMVLLEQGKRAIEKSDRTVASQAFLRLRELLWALEPRNRSLAERVLPNILKALEDNELEKARVPSLQLGNVLVGSKRYAASLLEFFDNIIGYPVESFANEPAPQPLGQGVEVAFEGSMLSSSAGTGALAVSFLNEDDIADIVWARTDGQIEVRSSGTPATTIRASANQIEVADLDNDVQLDLILLGGTATRRAVGSQGKFEPTGVTPLAGTLNATHLTVLDADGEGDLDVVAITQGERGTSIDLLRNDGTSVFESIGANALPPLDLDGFNAVAAGDIDRDGDHDLLLATDSRLYWIDNLRQGAFRDRTRSAGLARAPGAKDVELGDLDNNGTVDLVLAGRSDRPNGVLIYSSNGGVLRQAQSFTTDGAVEQSVLLDADNDGFLDIALITSQGIEVFVRRGENYTALQSPEKSGTEPKRFAQIVAEDADGDGDLDLFAAGPSGLYLYTNQGGNTNGWTRISLRGLSKSTGSDKNNAFGLGNSVEVFVGSTRQYRETRSHTTHLGLGSVKKPDQVRVVWTNGVPQNRISPEPKQLIVEEQVLKGSCPFLYTYTGAETSNGSGIEFVTDLLWGAPIGMPVAEGVYAEADPHELVVVTGAQPRDGAYDIRITEELWEAAYFDQTRLWIVDHPQDTLATGSLRVMPGPAPPKDQWADRVLLAGDLRPVAAWDGHDQLVTDKVAKRDDIYADGYTLGPYQGISDPWTFTFDLGTAPAAPVRLVLDGWIFPSDASINVAASQRSDIDFAFTRLEVETETGWQKLMDPMGFPAGKTKTTVVDTPPLPPGASKLRIVTSRWLHWDRIAWSLATPDDAATVVAKLDPSSADLRYRGYSQLVRKAPNAPHEYNYDELMASPWIPFPGSYTRFGDVRELLLEVDGGMVVMAAGDEMRLTFDASALPPVKPGYRRTVFLESYGWDKDADRNTLDVDRTWPLPQGTAIDEGQKTEQYLTRRVTNDTQH